MKHWNSFLSVFFTRFPSQSQSFHTSWKAAHSRIHSHTFFRFGKEWFLQKYSYSCKKKKKETSIEQLNFFFKGLNICYCLHIYYLSTETRSQINGEISHSIWPAYVQVYMYGHTAERVKRDVKNMRPRNTLAKPRHCLQTALLYYS